MTIPSSLPPQAEFHHAVLRHLAQLPEGDRQVNIYEAVGDLLNLNPSQRSERLANMPHLRYRHRAGWSLGVLKKRGFIERPLPRVWRITETGRELLSKYPDGFAGRSAIQLFQENGGKLGQGNAADNGANIVASIEPQQAPEERIDDALGEIRRSVAQELLDRIASAPSAFFEELVLNLLHAMGYGSTDDDIELVGRPGDGGIDGIISLDKLGFERVCVQAKRWNGNVGRPDIQAFYGALAGRRARKGVFITTSSFTRDARDFVERVADSIVLIDGVRLTSLMIEYGIGVTHYRVLPLPKVDDDFFDAE